MAEGKVKSSRNGAYVFLQLLFPSLRSFLRRAQRLAAMPHSHHSHSGQFCAHARGTLEEVVQAAVRRGFTTYGLSEHAPRALLDHLYPEELEAGLIPPDLAARFDAYVVEAHRLKDAFDGEIQLLVGLETENISHQDLVYLESVLVKYGARIEYVVGSVHHVKGIPIDFDRPTYDRALATFGTGSAAMSSFLSAYFDAQYELLVAVQPEIIGHVDLCRLYEPALKLEEYPEAWGKLERNVRYAIEYGALFEFNAAALRKNWPGAYPGGDVVQVRQPVLSSTSPH
jgi:histidinol-phosphatase (PHP family)